MNRHKVDLPGGGLREGTGWVKVVIVESLDHQGGKETTAYSILA